MRDNIPSLSGRRTPLSFNAEIIATAILTLHDRCKQAYLSPVSLISNAVNIKKNFYLIKVSPGIWVFLPKGTAQYQRLHSAWFISKYH